jgi:lysine 2,3-aminomutase
MEVWQQELQQAVTSVDQLARLLPIDPAAVARVCERYPLRIPHYYLRLIEAESDPIWRQCIPAADELENGPGLCQDPLAEAEFSPVPGLVHRHPDRALLLVSSSCPMNCRFCFRKNRLAAGELDFRFSALEQAITYLEGQPEVREIILTGGEPLLLSDLLLETLLKQLRRLPQLQLIRIHTRVPAVLPSRITEKLAALLGRQQPLYLNTHFNHPRELTPEAEQACARLANAGIPLGNQTVLLKGVNDQTEILENLFRGLLRLRVRPYYLHQMDLTSGTGHFRTPLTRGIELMDSLQGRLSGMAIPQFVVDLPRGEGKVPLFSERLVRTGARLQIRASTGKLIDYSEASDTGEVAG